MNYELRRRTDDLDGPRPVETLYMVRAGAALADVLGVAAQARDTMDVFGDGAYLVTYCGESPYWYPDDDGAMHQIGSHGWCHDCHKGEYGEPGYVHHLAYETELAVLTLEASDDRVLRRQCEADGLTPEQYAAGIAGRAVPLHGDESFVIAVHELGVNADGLAEFAVDMWDFTTWKVAVEVADGAPRAAGKLAEHLAYSALPKRCHDCKGTRGHAKDCSVTREREFLEKYPHLRTGLPGEPS